VVAPGAARGEPLLEKSGHMRVEVLDALLDGPRDVAS
jgi:hypothetical protein